MQHTFTNHHKFNNTIPSDSNRDFVHRKRIFNTKRDFEMQITNRKSIDNRQNVYTLSGQATSSEFVKNGRKKLLEIKDLYTNIFI